MKLTLNPEFRICFYAVAAVGALFTAVSFFLNIICGILCLLLTATALSAMCISAKKRYSKINELTDKISRILSGDSSVRINSCSEGELSLLQGEVQKMLLQLREKNDSLESERAYLSDSIADISHQIRTPLTSVNLIVTLLQQGELTETERQTKLLELSSMISKTDRLVTTLLKISKLDAGTVSFERRRVGVKQLIEKSSEGILIPMDIKNQRLSVNAGDEYYTGDFLWSTEAVGNILKNAMEHTPEGGEICVTCRQTPIFTEIEIADSGHGFDKQDLSHIFERFYKGKNASNDSYGIGLNLASMIIKKQNGTVTAKNRPEGGAVFIIRFYETTV